MSLLRIRRTVRLLPGALLSAGAMPAGGSWRDRHTLSGRELLRTLPPVGEPGAGQSGASGAPPRRAPRKQPVTAVPLLAGAVLVLWLLLALSGHH